MSNSDRPTPKDPSPPYISTESDFKTIYGAAKHWYAEYRKAMRPQWVFRLAFMALGVVAGVAVSRWLIP